MIYVTYVRVRGHVLENEIVAGVFPPVADDNEYIALCHLRDLKPLLLLYNTMCVLWLSPESSQDSGLRQNLFNMNIYSIAIHQVYTSMSI